MQQQEQQSKLNTRLSTTYSRVKFGYILEAVITDSGRAFAQFDRNISPILGLSSLLVSFEDMLILITLDGLLSIG